MTNDTTYLFPELEIWKSVIGWESDYEISNYGRLRRLTSSKGRKVGDFVYGTPHKRGYVQITLCKDGYKTIRLLHQVVAEAFIGQCPSGYTVNHIDLNKINNHVSNLEYMTRSENTKHQHKHGATHFVRGEKIGLAKLTENNVREIRQLISQDVRLQVIADRFGVSFGTIHAIKIGRTWIHVK